MGFRDELNELLAGEKANQINPNITQAWKAKRLGKFTSSQINKLMGKSKTGGDFTAGAESHIYKKVAETLTLECNEISSAAIKWGEEHEEDAVRMYERLHNKKVTYYGKQNPVFFEYGEHCGGSPDGFIEDEKAVIETKCPFESGNHAEVLHLVTTGKFDLKKYDGEYYGQVQMNMYLMESNHAYFISYDPRVVDYKYSIAAARIERDNDYLDALIKKIDLAIALKVTLLTAIGYYN